MATINSQNYRLYILLFPNPTFFFLKNVSSLFLMSIQLGLLHVAYKFAIAFAVPSIKN